MKKTFGLVLAVCMLLAAQLGAHAAAVSGNADGKIILQEDFNGTSIGQKEFKFIAATGYIDADGGHYVMDGTAGNKRYLRQLNTAAAESLKTGTYSVQADFNFSTIKDTGGLMRSADSTGNDYAYQFSTSSNNLVLTYFDMEGNVKTSSVCVLEAGKDYTLKALFSLETNELFVFVNGARALKNTELYISKVNGAVTGANNDIDRIFDSDSRSGAVYKIDNIQVKKDYIPQSLREYTVFTENFNGAVSGYAAAITTLKSDSELENPICIDGSAWYAGSGAASRLTKDKVYPGGTVKTALDFYVEEENGARYGIVSASNSARNETLKDNNLGKSGGGELVYNIYMENGILYAANVNGTGNLDQNGSQNVWGRRDSVQLSQIDTKKWYNLEVEYDIETLELKFYLNGTRCAPSEPMYIWKQKDYGTIFNIDHRGDYANASIYYDNIMVSCGKATAPGGYKTVIDSNQLNYNSGYWDVEKSTVIEADSLKIDNSRAIFQTPAVSTGTYGAEVDVKFASYYNGENLPEIISAQNTSADKLFCIVEKDKSLSAYAYTAEGVVKCARLIENLNLNTWYHLRYKLNLDTGRIHFYINGFEVAGETVLYVNPKVDKDLARVFDFNGVEEKTKYTEVFYVDNYVFYHDTLGINFDSAYIGASMTLPSETAAGKPIVWLSSNNEIMNAATGGVNVPETGEAYVILTARVAENTVGAAAESYTMKVRSETVALTASAENGKAQVKATITGLDDKPVVLVCALYKDGRLVSVATTAAAQGGGMSLSENTAELAAGTYKLCGYLWNSLSDGMPYCQAANTAFTVSKE